MKHPIKYRTLAHAMTSSRKVRQAIPETSLDTLEQLIGQTEQGHSGQIRLVVEARWPFLQVRHSTPRIRALEWFSQLRIWDTEHNNGVLIYLLFAERDVEIIADRGINAKVSERQWETLCQAMEARFASGDFEAGLITGIQAVGQLLREHFPAKTSHNEQSDRPLLI